MNSRHPSTLRETVCGLAILLLLAAIAAGVFLRQFEFNPAVLAGAAPPPEKAASPFAPFLPPTLKPLSELESFTPVTLSDKIDGKAELYLAAGIARMGCQRFAMADKPILWLELFQYEMNSPIAAFSVFSSQRRGDVQPLPLTALAYKTRNALFFAKGKSYHEIIGSAQDPKLEQAMLEIARKLANSQSGADANLGELELFPPEGMKPGSVTLLLSDVFGFDQLKQVFVASYTQGNLFVSRQDSPQKAEALAKAYAEFLLANGGTEEKQASSGQRWINMLGSWESIIVQGPVLAGVHECDNREAAGQLTHALLQRIQSHERTH